MDRFGKLFGRKPEQTAPLEGGKTEHPASSDIVQVGKSPEAENREIFGLKLVQDTGKEYSISALPVTIGRSEANQIVLADETISSSHATIYYDELAQAVCILDLDSLNGIYVDHSPTRRNILSDGVKIKLGAVEFTFRDTGYIHNQQAAH